MRILVDSFVLTVLVVLCGAIVQYVINKLLNKK